MMIKELYIKNFRCFKNTLASSFKNINLKCFLKMIVQPS